MRTIAKIAFIISFFTLTAYSQDKAMDSLISSGIQEIYRLEFSSAEHTFRTVMSDYPDQPAGRFFLAMIDWWKILVDLDNESYDDLFFEKLEDVIFQCDKLLDKNENNIDALFFKGGAIGFRGRLRAIRESWLKAADDGREALPIVQRAAKLEPNNKDVQLGFGIYNYYADVIPRDFPLIKPLMIFFPSGNKDQGISQLTETAKYGKYAKYEARYFLMTIYSGYERDYTKAWEYATQLCSDFPNNPVFEKWKGRIGVQAGRRDEYKALFEDVYAKGERNLFGYNTAKSKREASYYLGMYYRDYHKPDSALVWFNKCDALAQLADGKKQTGYTVNALLNLGMMHDALGHRSEAITYYNRVLQSKEYGSSQTQAKRFLESPYSY